MFAFYYTTGFVARATYRAQVSYFLFLQFEFVMTLDTCDKNGHTFI